jgi:hypothetical protein
MRFASSQGSPIALTQYAPGKEVGILGKCYTSGAIYSVMSDRFTARESKRIYMERRECGFVTTCKIGEANRSEKRDCEAGGGENTFGPGRYWMRLPGFDVVFDSVGKPMLRQDFKGTRKKGLVVNFGASGVVVATSTQPSWAKLGHFIWSGRDWETTCPTRIRSKRARRRRMPGSPTASCRWAGATTCNKSTWHTLTWRNASRKATYCSTSLSKRHHDGMRDLDAEVTPFGVRSGMTISLRASVDAAHISACLQENRVAPR